MAGEILILEKQADYQVFFLYPITVPRVVGGMNVIPTPSAGLPAIAQRILTAGELADLDSGRLAFEVVGFTRTAGLTAAQELARIREIYAARKAGFDTWYTETYHARVGLRFDA